jgi:NADPH:quinone reductase-like Zn-dependent oxidoreductase
LQALRYEGRILFGRKVLIYGASGGIGSFAVQIAKAMGAEVTGVCSSANLELVRSLGADHVIDYTKEDFTKNGIQYDRIIATAGYNSIFAYKRSLSQYGVYVMVGGAMKGKNGMTQIIQALMLGPLLSSRTGRKLGSLTVKWNKKDLVYVKRLIEAGKVKPVIDRSYPLSEVPAALRYYEDRHAKGKVVITMSA